MKFIDIVWAAFFARVNPVSTIANPACMNITRKPASNVHTKLMAILLCPTVSITSVSVGFFASFTVTSAPVPVGAPVGSPRGCPMAPCACAVYGTFVTVLRNIVSSAAAATLRMRIAPLFISGPFMRVRAIACSIYTYARTHPRDTNSDVTSEPVTPRHDVVNDGRHTSRPDVRLRQTSGGLESEDRLRPATGVG